MLQPTMPQNDISVLMAQEHGDLQHLPGAHLQLHLLGVLAGSTSGGSGSSKADVSDLKVTQSCLQYLISFLLMNN
jgi:hypothetical protein